ncbi:MAG TPA: phosphoglucosamine mutase [Pyrinomonadaceae bacterium]|nr:phosphoglucosamine mutase [Pyrinomonadaceae bacterium]
MTKLFGTDGIRGEAGVFPLDAQTVEIIGGSLAIHLRNKLGRAPVIVVGRDTRESGEWIEKALARGITQTGAQSTSAGIITTPGVAFLARTIPADAGVVISASHNPYKDNGIKVFAPSGRKLDEDTERLIEQDVLAQEAQPSHGLDSSNTAPVTNDQADSLRERYLDFLAGKIGHDLSLRDVRLIVDCANGASFNVAARLFERLGASVTSINDTPDGRNINLGSGSLHMESLQDAVRQQKADLGVAFDGDADRSLFVDSGGHLVNGDATLWVLGKYLKSKGQLHHDTVVATVMSNIGLEIAFKSEGIELIRTDVGDKYVLEELLRSGATLGGEQSGHIIFPRLSLAGDGMITTLCLLRAMMEENRTLLELTAGFKNFPQILVNVEVAVKKPFAEIQEIQNAADNIEAELGTRGRLLLRYSGTESLARVMLEGERQDEIEKHADELATVIRKTLGS